MLPLGQWLHLKSCLVARVCFPSSRSLESRVLHSLAPLEVFCPYPLPLTMQRICPSVTSNTGAPVPLSPSSRLTHHPLPRAPLSLSLLHPLLALGWWEGRHIDFSPFFMSEYLCTAYIWDLSQTSSPRGCTVENWLTLSLWLWVNYALASFSILTVPSQLPNG